MNQTEIDELRRLHEAATPGPWEAATLSPKGLIPAIIQRDQDDWLPVAYFADEHGDGEAVDMEENRALIVAARNAIPRLLAALDEARAERSEARSLLLNGIQTNGDSLAFLEHVRREHAAVVAERDALKAKLAGAEDERDAYGADIHSVLEKSVGLVAERDALRAERDKANLRERNIFASLRMALGEDLGGGGGLVEILNGIEGLQDQRDAAESLAWDALGRPEGTHDTSNVQRLCEAHGALKAKLAALVKASQPFANDQGCDAVHHGLADRHDQRDTCPVVARLREALAAAKVQP